MFFAEILANVLSFRESSLENLTIGIINGQTTIDLTVVLSQLLLDSSLPGESYSISTGNDGINIVVESSKITETLYEACGQETGVVYLSEELLSQRSNNGSDFMDCSIIYSNANLHALSQIAIDEIGSAFDASFLNIDILPSNGSNTISTAAAHAATGIEYPLLPECGPIIFQLNMTNSTYFDRESGTTSNYPKCMYFNETSLRYQDDGCFVLSTNHDKGVIHCACQHLTAFSSGSEEFEPEANDFTSLKDVYAELSLENIIVNYPLGWIIVVTWICWCLTLMCIFNASFVRNKLNISVIDTPLVADTNVLYGEGNDFNINENYRCLQEAKLFDDHSPKKRSCLAKLCILWKLGILNDHIWVGIFCRFVIWFFIILFLII